MALCIAEHLCIAKNLMTKADAKPTQKDIDNKQLAPKPEKVEPAASDKTNARGSRQNFN